MENSSNTIIETIEDFDKKVLEVIQEGTFVMEFDEKDGEVMIRTGIYKWKDDSLHYEPEK